MDPVRFIIESAYGKLNEDPALPVLEDWEWTDRFSGATFGYNGLRIEVNLGWPIRPDQSDYDYSAEPSVDIAEVEIEDLDRFKKYLDTSQIPYELTELSEEDLMPFLEDADIADEIRYRVRVASELQEPRRPDAFAAEHVLRSRR